MALFYLYNRFSDSRRVLAYLGADSDFLFASVAESESHGAVDIDGAFVEQRYAEVWAEFQFVYIKVGGFLLVVAVGG